MEDQKTEYEGRKQNIRLYGIILLIIGIGLMVIGVGALFSAMTSSPDWDNFDAFVSQQMGTFFIGAIAVFVGFICAVVGYRMYFITHLRGVTRYAAIETAPAAEIMTEAVASGLSKGLTKDGRSPFSQGKEVIKIKCRECGYLETEDADFCSKCGEKR